jgi:tyrosine-protein phosphatase YwqE
MFFFRKRNKNGELPAELLSFLHTDMHSHLLPAIDDGVRDVDTSVNFISRLQHMGVRKIVTTPHIIMDRYPNSAATMAQPYEAVSAALQSNNISIPFHHAAEYYLDEQFVPLLQQPLLTISGNKVLVEISFVAAPPQLHGWLFDIQAAGYQPIMAHPERYPYYHADIDQYRQLKQLGCQLQVNLLSLTGYYGKQVQLAAEKLLAAGLIDYAGTDLHHERHLQAIAGIASQHKLRKTLEAYPFQNYTL